jgi:hypothetical protein
VESDTIHLNKIDTPLTELEHIWHFGDCFSMLEAFLSVFSKSLLLAPVAFGQKFSSSFIVSFFIRLSSSTINALI